MSEDSSTQTLGLLAIAKLQDIPDGGALARSIGDGQSALSLIITRRDRLVSIFLNRCPHTGVSLDWVPGRFMDADNKFLQCAVHGALFRPDNGYCLAGPCASQSLTALRARLIEDEVWVEIP